MAGNVTQTRLTPGQPGMKWRRGTDPANTFPRDHYTSGGAISSLPVQTTTSFRSGRTESLAVEDIPTDRLEAFKAYKKEYRDDRYRAQGDRGHPFTTTRQDLLIDSISKVTSLSGAGVQYQGQYFSDPLLHTYYGTSGYGFIPIPTWSNSGWYSGEAIARTAPDTDAQLAVSLAELYREGFPFRHHLDYARDATSVRLNGGSNYINWEFGWKPLVNETIAAVQAVRRAQQTIDRLIRDSGKWKRRGCVFPEEVLERFSRETGGRLAGPSGMGVPFENTVFPSGRLGTLHESYSVKREVYFRGAYSTFIPNESARLAKWRNYEYQLDRILGTRVTPEVLWELAPWSWLVDWKLNVQSVIHNASQLGPDKLVIRYGYLMCKTTSERTCTLSKVLTNQGTLQPVTTTYRTTRKERIAATPFGFGLNPSLFTTRQWSILAALSLSKSPKTMREW